jgi:hypothetical protein
MARCRGRSPTHSAWIATICTYASPAAGARRAVTVTVRRCGPAARSLARTAARSHSTAGPRPGGGRDGTDSSAGPPLLPAVAGAVSKPAWDANAAAGLDATPARTAGPLPCRAHARRRVPPWATRGRNTPWAPQPSGASRHAAALDALRSRGRVHDARPGRTARVPSLNVPARSTVVTGQPTGGVPEWTASGSRNRTMWSAACLCVYARRQVASAPPASAAPL